MSVFHPVLFSNYRPKSVHLNNLWELNLCRSFEELKNFDIQSSVTNVIERNQQKMQYGSYLSMYSWIAQASGLSFSDTVSLDNSCVSKKCPVRHKHMLLVWWTFSAPPSIRTISVPRLHVVTIFIVSTFFHHLHHSKARVTPYFTTSFNC